MKKERGITLIALVITIIVLLILAGITITLVLGDGLINKSHLATSEYNKQEAAEKMNLKITNVQILNFANKQVLPTLQELADNLCEDDEIEYVLTESKSIATIDKISVGDASSIFTKLKEYPYEFEINSSLQLASINGVKVSDINNGNSNNNSTNPNEEELWNISTYSSEGVSAYSSRVNNIQGGYKIIGKIVYVYIIVDSSINMGANDSWAILTGLPNPERTTSLDVSVSKSNNDLLGGINCAISDTYLRLALSSRAIPPSSIITIKGSYLMK